MTDPVEPVHLHARLRRSPDALYTEVAGCPVVCDVRERSVNVLSPDTVTLWASLDGRPLVEVLGPHADGWSADDRRGLVELVRRLKATGLVDDAAADEPGPDLPPLDGPGAPVDSVTVVGSWAPPATGPGDGTGTGTLVLARPGGAETGTVSVACRRPDGGTWVVEAGDGRRVTGVVVPEHLRVSADASPEAVALAAWACAVASDDELRRPGVLDALADLAEAVPVVDTDPTRA